MRARNDSPEIPPGIVRAELATADFVGEKAN